MSKTLWIAAAGVVVVTAGVIIWRRTHVKTLTEWEQSRIPSSSTESILQ